MKNTDLMTGDLVYNHRNWICPIVEIHKDSAVVIARHYGEEEFKLDDLRPIPLTPEILERNGFVRKKNWLQFGNFNNPPLILWHTSYDKVLNHWKNELEIHSAVLQVHARFVCNYVHELQHALRLCRIEKEIVL